MKKEEITRLIQSLSERERTRLVINIEVEELFKNPKTHSDKEKEKIIEFVESMYDRDYAETLRSYLGEAVFIVSLIIEKHGCEYLDSIDIDMFSDYFFEENRVIEEKKEERASFMMRAMFEVLNDAWKFRFKNIVN